MVTGVATPILRGAYCLFLRGPGARIVWILYLFVWCMVYFETLEQVYAHIQSHEVEHGLKYIIRSSSVGFGDDGWYWPPPLLLFIILSVNDDMHTAGSVHSQNAGTGEDYWWCQIQ